MGNYGKLILMHADGTEQTFRLTTETVTLGRATDNTITLVDAKASGLHARIECSDVGCTLIDENSSNYTYVDGHKITQAKLQTGNVIRIGNSRLRYEAQDPTRKRSTQATQARKLIGQFLDSIADDDTLDENILRDKLIHVPRLVIHTPDRTWELKLANRDHWTIGRAEDNDIVINHQKVSRYHARIERQGDDAFIIRDLGSGNGTRLGNRPITEHTLYHTDTLNIGYGQLVFKDNRHVDESVEAKRQSHRLPVVVVPGNFGSELWQRGERLWPNIQALLRAPERLKYSADIPTETPSIVGEVVVVPKLVEIESYGRIGDYLEQHLKYTRGKDLLEFAYDWRDDVSVAAQKLAETINNWHVEGPIAIIAHSLGALVSRCYIDAMGGDSRVKRLMLVGGANYGNPAAVLSLLLGDKSDLHAKMPVGGALQEKIVEIFATFPMMYQMLPTYPSVVDQHGQPIELYKDDSWLPAEKRPLLHLARSFRKKLKPGGATVSTVCVFGYGLQTVTQVKITVDDRGNWTQVESISTKDGDNSLPTQTTVLEGAEIHPIQQGHNQLYVDEDVLMRLKYELVAAS